MQFVLYILLLINYEISSASGWHYIWQEFHLAAARSETPGPQETFTTCWLAGPETTQETKDSQSSSLILSTFRVPLFDWGTFFTCQLSFQGEAIKLGVQKSCGIVAHNGKEQNKIKTTISYPQYGTTVQFSLLDSSSDKKPIYPPTAVFS